MIVLLMTQLAIALSLGLSGGFMDVASYARADSGGQVPDESTRASKAVELYRAQRLLEAAVAFEELWRDFRAPGYLFNAALARERLGHEALAYVHLQRFLAEQIGPSERATAERRLQDLRFRAVPVEIELTGVRPADKDLQFVVRKLPGGETIAVEASLLAVADRPNTFELYVEIGTWTVTASAPGYRTAEVAVEARPGTPAALSVTMAEEMVPFGMRIEPPEAVVAGIRVRLIPRSGGAPIEGRVTARDAQWQLAPGAYTVELSAPDFEPKTLEVQVGSASALPPILLQRAASRSPAVVPDRRLAIGLGAASAAIFAGSVITLGITLAAYQERRSDYLRTGMDRSYDWIDDVYGLHRNIRGQNVGFMLLGASVGGALGVGLTTARERRRVIGAELGTGAVLLVGGTIAFGVVRAGLAAQRLDDNNFVKSGVGGLASDAASIDRRMAGMGVTGFFAGTGAALLVSGVAEWVRSRRGEGASRVDVSASVHSGGGGLMLSGRF